MAKNNNEEFFESSSSTKFKVVKLKHNWTINNFSLSCEQTGQCLNSPTFSAGTNGEQSKWHLSLYPKGRNKKSNKYVSLYLHLDNCKGKGIYATYHFGIMNDFQHVKISNDSRRFTASGESWGYEKFVTQDYLCNEFLVDDDELTIVCEITAKIGGSKNVSVETT